MAAYASPDPRYSEASIRLAAARMRVKRMVHDRLFWLGNIWNHVLLSKEHEGRSVAEYEAYAHACEFYSEVALEQAIQKLTNAGLFNAARILMADRDYDIVAPDEV